MDTFYLETFLGLINLIYFKTNLDIYLDLSNTIDQFLSVLKLLFTYLGFSDVIKRAGNNEDMCRMQSKGTHDQSIGKVNM